MVTKTCFNLKWGKIDSGQYFIAAEDISEEERKLGSTILGEILHIPKSSMKILNTKHCYSCKLWSCSKLLRNIGLCALWTENCMLLIFNVFSYLLQMAAQKKGPVFIDPQYGDSEEDEVVDYGGQGQSCPWNVVPYCCSADTKMCLYSDGFQQCFFFLKILSWFVCDAKLWLCSVTFVSPSVSTL